MAEGTFGMAATGAGHDLSELADEAGGDLLTGGAVVLDGAAEWSRRSGRASYDPGRFFQATAFESPYGAILQIGYDDHGLLPAWQTDPLGNSMRLQHNYRVLQPFLLTTAGGPDPSIAPGDMGLIWYVRRAGSLPFRAIRRRSFRSTRVATTNAPAARPLLDPPSPCCDPARGPPHPPPPR